ncbi:MAG: HAD family phosphatase [Gammaproteobacteria bacterium]|nr:HAD family phosphatase [Gammaproteobacteria bacterium]
MKLIIFDCDGVLVDSEALLVELEMAFLEQHGLSFTIDSYIDQFMGIPVKDWISNTTALLVEKTGGPLSDDFFSPLESAITRKLKEDLRPIEGALEAIKALNCNKCVASSSSINSLNNKLTHTGLYDVFSPHIFSTQLVEKGKPSPDLFLHAASKLETSPGDCVVIEDSANGVTAGKRAGMKVIGFTGGGHCPPGHGNSLLSSGADLIAKDFSDLVSLLS